MSKRTLYKPIRCSRCGMPLWKHQKIFSFPGYETKEGLWFECNAIEAVKGRFRRDKEIGAEELKLLPNTLMFDPDGTDPEEASIGIWLSDTIKRCCKG